MNRTRIRLRASSRSRLAGRRRVGSRRTALRAPVVAGIAILRPSTSQPPALLN